MDNIYSPPESDVTVGAYGNINLFKRFSIWYTLILIILTLRLYLLYWLHTRTKILNQIVHNRISVVFSSAATLLYVAMFVLLMAEILFDKFPIFPDSIQYFTYFPMLDIISNIVIFMWVFKFRNRLQEIFSGSDFYIGIVPTFFCLQFKINMLTDRQQQSQRRQSHIVEHHR